MLYIIIFCIVIMFVAIASENYRLCFRKQIQAFKRQVPMIAAYLKKQRVKEKIPIRIVLREEKELNFFPNKKLVGIGLKL